MKYLFFIVLLGMVIDLNGQVILPLEEAIQTTLLQNHQIRIKKSEADAQALRVDPALVGKKPVANLQASYEFGWSDAEIETLPTGPMESAPLQLDGTSNDLIIAPEISLVLLDGKAGTYRLEQLATASRLAQLELRQTVEQTVATVSLTYLQMAEVQTQLGIAQQRLAVTNDRLQRAQSAAAYGTSGSLNDLQIQVDLRTDSAAIRDLQLAHDNARRELNRVMGQDLEVAFLADTQLTLDAALDLPTLAQQLQQNNVILQLRAEGVNLAALDVQLSKSAYRPQLQAYANASFMYLQDNASFLQSTRTIGPNAGLRFSYPLFDGGARRINEQTAVIAQERSLLEKEDTEAELLKELHITYTTYQNTISQLRTAEADLSLFEQNLQNIRNRYAKGLATNTDVRSAQLNLDAALNRLSSYRFRIKQAEIQLFLLSGQLVD